MIWGDYHIHTTYSGNNGHATQTPRDIFEVANKLGLKQVGLCDHGFNHMLYATTPMRVKKLKQAVEELNGKNQVRLLMGIEANIFSLDGEIDLQNVDRGVFDIVVAGFHKMVWAKKLKDGIDLSFPQVFGTCTDQVKKRFTSVVISTIKTQKIDILAHPGYGFPLDVKEVAKAAADYGVRIELNGKRINLTDEEVLVLAQSDAKIVANSDAHSPERVGDVSKPIELLTRLGIPIERVENFVGVSF